MSIKLTRMGLDHLFVKRILDCPKPKWWTEICRLSKYDKNFNLQIRGDSINLYYKMHSFMKLSYNSSKNEFVAKIHHKYLPIKYLSSNTDKQPYLDLNFEDDKVSIYGLVQTQVLTEDLLNDTNIKLITREMEKYIDEEKRFQSRLIEHNYKTILDAEVAIELGSGERARIDLVHFDKKLRKIIAVELKLFGDKRLYSDDIRVQLRKYIECLEAENSEIITKAYQNVIRVKKAFGLIPQRSILSEIENRNLKLETKPLLAIVCYNQHIINNFKEKILNNIKPIQNNLLGLYFIGKTIDLNISQHKNKIYFGAEYNL